jgi:hypothetical protein
MLGGVRHVGAGWRTDGGALRFGANYVPSRGWFYSWLDFTPDDVRRDLADLATLGFDHIRVFPIWPWIQPNRGHIREQGVADLLATIDIAAELGLDVAVDLVQGHLSSFDFLPSWTLTWHQRSVFEDGAVLDGLTSYVDAVSRAVATRPNVFAVTIGNEVNNLYPSSSVTRESARSWASHLIDVIRDAAPRLHAVHSLHDEAFYVPGHPFGPVDSTDLGDLTSVHAWVFTGVSELDAPDGPATRSHADYLIELAAAIGDDPHRPIWLQEIGAPQPDIPAEAAAEFVTGTLEQVLDNPLLWGVTWWCSHDVDRRLVDFPEREYDLGLFTVDHRLKPAGRAIGAAMSRERAREAFRQRSTRRVQRPALVAPDDLRSPELDRIAYAPGSAFHLAWVELRAEGSTAIVSADRVDQVGYLEARGIDQTLDLAALLLAAVPGVTAPPSSTQLL